jgi:hypothetical protein
MVIKTPWSERKRIDLGIVKIIFLISAILLLFYVSKVSGVFISPQWEHVDAITVDSTVQNVTYTVVFDQYKPENCEDGIYVSDGDIQIPFEIINFSYENGECLNATIMFNNTIYGTVPITPQQENVTPEKPITPEKEIEKEKTESADYEKTARSAITGQASEEVTGSFQQDVIFKTYYIFYGAVSGAPAPPFEKEIPRENVPAPEKETPVIIVEVPELPANLTNVTNETIPEGCALEQVCENQTVCNAIKSGEGETYTIQEVCRNESVCRQEIVCNQTNVTEQNIAGNGFAGQFKNKLDPEGMVNLSFSEGAQLKFGISEINKQKPNDANLTVSE